MLTHGRFRTVVLRALRGPSSRERVLSGLDVANLAGLEIGPLNNPLVRKSDGDITYVDYLGLDALRAKYEHDPYVDCGEIIGPDVIWNADLAQAVGGRKFDYVLASHVVEHVPNLIGWLEEIRSVLKPAGTLRLIVPDRRYTFDYLRRESTLAELIDAYVSKARVPLPRAVFDYYLGISKVGIVNAWLGLINANRLTRFHDAPTALHVAKQAREGAYIDVHCWVFTPYSFAELFFQASELGLIQYRCERIWRTRPGYLDFAAVLRPSDDKGDIVGSWKRAIEQSAARQWRRH
jgi:SAM-dependent methyltransferase